MARYANSQERLIGKMSWDEQVLFLRRCVVGAGGTGWK